jgi:hypothetical protein
MPIKMLLTVVGLGKTSFWKLITLPALPPVGMKLLLTVNHGSYWFKVKEVSWNQPMDYFMADAEPTPSFFTNESEPIRHFLADHSWSPSER